MKNSKLMRLQLDKQFGAVRSAATLSRPIYGWIKAIRNALGMTSSCFAKRMGVSQARASAIESQEIEDSLTIKTLKEAASALNCRLTYFLIPEKTLEETATEQSLKYIKDNNRQIAHSMGLENQSLTGEDSEDFIKLQAEEVLLKNINRIWESRE